MDDVTYTSDSSSVPEPSSLALLLAGSVILATLKLGRTERFNLRFAFFRSPCVAA